MPRALTIFLGAELQARFTESGLSDADFARDIATHPKCPPLPAGFELTANHVGSLRRDLRIPANNTSNARAAAAAEQLARYEATIKELIQKVTRLEAAVEMLKALPANRGRG